MIEFEVLGLDTTGSSGVLSSGLKGLGGPFGSIDPSWAPIGDPAGLGGQQILGVHHPFSQDRSSCWHRVKFFGF